jgi:DNA-binding HxlR family transcriptional regulator
MQKANTTNKQNRIHLDGICPMGYALSKIGSRWKPLILFKLIGRRLRFCELKEEIPAITERMLTLSLREMERDGLVIRLDSGGYPKKVEYSLSESANELNSVLEQICAWGAADLRRFDN